MGSEMPGPVCVLPCPAACDPLNEQVQILNCAKDIVLWLKLYLVPYIKLWQDCDDLQARLSPAIYQ